MKKSIEIVVAVCNEEEAIPVFLRSAQSLTLPEGVALRFLFVEDSSTDRTVDVLRAAAQQDRNVRFCSLEKGYGQSAALFFGMSRTESDAVITMDVDQGHPVELIAEMAEGYVNGADIVQAVRRDIQGRSAYRDFGTRAFGRLARWMTGVDLNRQNVHYRLMSDEVRRWALRNRRLVHFSKFPFPPFAKSVSYVGFSSPPRTVGESKYGFARLLFHAANGILAIMPPLRVATATAVLAAAGGGLMWLGRWLSGGALLAGGAALCGRYVLMGRAYVFERLRVKEEG